MNKRPLAVLPALVCVVLLRALPARAQFSQQGPKKVGSGAVNFAGSGVYQGGSTAISADGNTALVGGYGDNIATGASWVWTRNAGVWSQQGPKLVDNDSQAAFQGAAVGLSGDGNTAIIGGYSDNFGAGAVWIWRRNGTVWSQLGEKLIGTGATGLAFQGYSVAISADGNTAIVGGIFDNSQVGAAWIWKRNGSTWAQQGPKLVGSNSIGKAEQGWSVALSADGNTAIVGGYADNIAAGAVWIWTRSPAGVWTQQGPKLVGTGAAGIAAQGSGVALSADGNTAIVGGYSDHSGVGAVWFWTRSGGVWSQVGNKLIATGAIGESQQGAAVSLSADGKTLVVGGPGDNFGTGAAWVWKRSGNAFTQLGTKLVGSGAAGFATQGYSAALSGDGRTAIVGGLSDNTSDGAAWFFAGSAVDPGGCPPGGRQCIVPAPTRTPEPINERAP
jgi:hypothetical protein